MGTEWFRDARFGIFIHWGPYSLHGRCVWARYRERIPSSEYDALARRFKASRYDPDEWVEICQNAGAKYMVLCTRQHPGFSLFDSKVSDFTAPKYAAGRDLVAGYAEACRRRGMKVGFYYSLLDWRYPAYFDGPRKNAKGWASLVDYVHAQVRELCTNYGAVDLMWYDGWWPWTAEDWRADELNAMGRELQPGIVINDRSGAPADYDTPEQNLPRAAHDGRPWEACMTMNDHWAYSPQDKNWKTTRQLIHMLVQCASHGGNLLLDIGPKPDGTFPVAVLNRLAAVGRWAKVHSEALYGTGWFPLNLERRVYLKEDTILSKIGATTWRPNTLYCHVFHWPKRRLTLANVKNRVLSARIVTTGQELRCQREGERVVLHDLPRKAPDPYDTVIAVELGGEPQAHDHFRFVP